MGNFCYRCMQPTIKNGVCAKCGEPETSSNGENALKPGTIVGKGRLTVGKKLGSGGFGVTYIAYDNKLQRRVALKEFMPGYLAVRKGDRIEPKPGQDQAYQKSMNSFLKEARALYELRAHPNIVHVISVFKENNTAFYTMEMLEGESFLSYLRRKKKISANRAFQMLLPIMKAIQYIHTKKMIHRDISPDNIMLCEDPSHPGAVVPKLIDFGAAHVAIEGFSLSYPGVKKNGFSPLEQNWEGNSQGPWTDVYSFCATFYSAIVGNVPVAAQTRAEADRDPLKLPRELGADIVPAMQDVLMRGLKIQYAERIQSMEQLIREMSDAAQSNQNSTVLEVSRAAVVQEPKRPTARRVFSWLLEVGLLAAGVFLLKDATLFDDLGLTGDPLILSLLIFPGVVFLLDLLLLITAGSTIGQLFFGIKTREEDGEGSPHFGSALAYAILYASYGLPIGFLLGLIWLVSGKNIGPLESLAGVTVGRRHEAPVQAHGMAGLISRPVPGTDDTSRPIREKKAEPAPEARQVPPVQEAAEKPPEKPVPAPVPAPKSEPRPEPKPQSAPKPQPAPRPQAGAYTQQTLRPQAAINQQPAASPQQPANPQPAQRPQQAAPRPQPVTPRPQPAPRSQPVVRPQSDPRAQGAQRPRSQEPASVPVQARPVRPPMPASGPKPQQPAQQKGPTASLVCLKAADTAAAVQGKAVAVRDGSRLGKSAQKATIVIPDKTVSGLHCSFRFTAGKGWSIKDEESTNGTYVNAVRLPSGGTSPLQNGAKIITGKETFEFRC